MSTETVVREIIASAPRYGVIELTFIDGSIKFVKTTTSKKLNSEENPSHDFKNR